MVVCNGNIWRYDLLHAVIMLSMLSMTLGSVFGQRLRLQTLPSAPPS